MLAHSEKPFTLDQFSTIIQYANNWNLKDAPIPEISPKGVFKSVFTKLAANLLIKKLNNTDIEHLRDNSNLRRILRHVLVRAIIPRHHSEVDINGQRIWHTVLAMNHTLGYVINLSSYYLERYNKSWFGQKGPAYTVADPEKSFATYVLNIDPENRNDPEIVTYTPQEAHRMPFPDRIKIKTPDYLLSQMLFYIGLLLEKKLQEKAALLAYTCAEILYPQPNTLVSMGNMHLQNIGSDPQALDKANAINEILQRNSPETAVAMIFQGHIHLAHGRKKEAAGKYFEAFEKRPHDERIYDLVLEAEGASNIIETLVSKLSYPFADNYLSDPRWYKEALIRYPDGRTPWTL